MTKNIGFISNSLHDFHIRNSKEIMDITSSGLRGEGRVISAQFKSQHLWGFINVHILCIFVVPINVECGFGETRLFE